MTREKQKIVPQKRPAMDISRLNIINKRGTSITNFEGRSRKRTASQGKLFIVAKVV